MSEHARGGDRASCCSLAADSDQLIAVEISSRRDEEPVSILICCVVTTREQHDLAVGAVEFASELSSVVNTGTLTGTRLSCIPGCMFVYMYCRGPGPLKTPVFSLTSCTVSVGASRS